MNRTVIYNFTESDDMGEGVKEVTHGGVDVVIECVGMDGKKSPLEFVEQKLKLQGRTLGPIQIATKAVKKCGIIQRTGVYGGLYNMFPLGPFFTRNITLKTGQAHARSYMYKLYHQIVQGDFDPTEIITHRMMLQMVIKCLTEKKMIVLRLYCGRDG